MTCADDPEHHAARCYGSMHALTLYVPSSDEATGARAVTCDWPRAWRVLADDGAPWGTLTMIERAQQLDICLPGLLAGAPPGQVGAAYDLIEAERHCSAYHVLPCGGGLDDERADVVEGFGVIRAAVDDLKARYLDQMKKDGAHAA